jgi:HEAT repeats
MRTIVASEIGPTGDRRIFDALVALSKDEDGYVREAAAIGLETQGDPCALEPLRAMVRRERKDTVAKARAKHAIRMLEKRAGSCAPPDNRDGSPGNTGEDQARKTGRSEGQYLKRRSSQLTGQSAEASAWSSSSG